MEIKLDNTITADLDLKIDEHDRLEFNSASISGSLCLGNDDRSIYY